MRGIGSAIGESLARSLVERLGPECAAGALVARAIISTPDGVVDLRRLDGAPAGALERVLHDFVLRGWVAAEEHCWVMGPNAIPPGVPFFLDGAAVMRSSLRNDGRATAVVTMPSNENGLVRALPATGFNYAGLVTSDHAFERIADAAVGAFTILSPFLNPAGFNFALELFQRTSAPRKILVVRRYGGALAAVRERWTEIQAAGITVRNYTLPLPAGYETFHAKIVLADQDLAYVGSANMTRYERSSMELGVMMDGQAARVVASVVHAVEAVAYPVRGSR